MNGVAQLNRIAFLLERSRAGTHRVRAFRRAAAALAELSSAEVRRLTDEDRLTEVPGVGAVTASVVREAANGETSAYLARLEEQAGPLVEADAGASLRAALRGDLHVHSDWSDGGSPIELMASTARELGHEYLALTDHSPRLRVANGLSAERLRRQLRVVRELNERLAPFRILTGIEVDIRSDGSLDQDPELLDQLDVVVASVHSELAMPADEMTPRMVAAIANPRVDVLGHVTGRLVTGERGTRGESAFDPEIVFEACRRFGVALEINARPERLDPPRRLLATAAESGCLFSIDTDAHAPGQLDWQVYGCARAEECGIGPDRVINALPADELAPLTG